MRGAWGGTGSRGGHHLRRSLHGAKTAPEPTTEPAPEVCPDCGAPIRSAMIEVGAFVAPGRRCTACPWSRT